MRRWRRSTARSRVDAAAVADAFGELAEAAGALADAVEVEDAAGAKGGLPQRRLTPRA